MVGEKGAAYIGPNAGPRRSQETRIPDEQMLPVGEAHVPVNYAQLVQAVRYGGSDNSIGCELA